MKNAIFALVLSSGCLDVWTSDAELYARDADGDGVPERVDCDDADRQVGRHRFWRDADGDGYGDPDQGLGCERPADLAVAEVDGDCDDEVFDIHPESTWFIDEDGDGWLSDQAEFVRQCEDPDGGDLSASPQYWLPASTTGLVQFDALGWGDCDDSDAFLHPATEWTPDADGDGYGDMNPAVDELRVQCAQPPSYERFDSARDCDDSDAERNPLTGWYLDRDGDGYGQYGALQLLCEPTEGYGARRDDDCNDNNAAFTTACEFVVVGVGFGGACGGRTQGRMTCWDDGGNTFESGDEVRLYEVDLTDRTVCGLRNNVPYCFGDTSSLGDVGDAGSGFTKLALVPTLAETGEEEVSLRLLSGGELLTWRGGAWVDEPSVASDFLTAGGAVSPDESCALRGVSSQARVLCWGDEQSPLVSDAPSDEGVSSLALSSSGACVITQDEEVRCWGESDPLVDGVPTSGAFSQVAVGRGACAVNDAQEVVCWGGARGRAGVRL